MTKIRNWILNVILGVAVILFLILFFSVIFHKELNVSVKYILPTLVFTLGIVLLALNVKSLKKAYITFTSLTLITCSVLLFLLLVNLIPGTIMNWWPMLGIISGIALNIAGFIKYKKVKYGYLIPSVVLFLTGAWFMLFSFNVISIPFIEVAVIGGPLLLIMCVVIMCVMLYFQQTTKTLIAQDDNSQFEDDELFSEKN